ncbi:hypothetical protein AMECASPLE_035298 [Ameca splendens]|uniref:Uncharacterized protein n=1 Tax=Ameca splendens TaxID=208324 RepID=A0ABV0ZG58_9TELE
MCRKFKFKNMYKNSWSIRKYNMKSCKIRSYYLGRWFFNVGFKTLEGKPSEKSNYFSLNNRSRKLWENDYRLPWPLLDHTKASAHTDSPLAAWLHKDSQFFW